MRIVAFAFVAVAVAAQQVDVLDILPLDCENQPVSTPLCNDAPAKVSLEGQCRDEIIEFPVRQPCCAVQTILDHCHVDLGEGKCRSVEVTSPSCPPSDENFCALEGMELKLKITRERNEEPCCETCSCFGDPHCLSFDGTEDSWILCDSRVYSKRADTCKLVRSVCLNQNDHLGQPCVWKNKPSSILNWNVGLLGSRCVFKALLGNGDPMPEMLMYEADSFKLWLVMGERGIIQAMKLEDGGEFYYLDADACFNDIDMPWRPSPTATEPEVDPLWLPNRWASTIIEGGDILWSATKLPSGVFLNIRCSRNRVPSGSDLLLGPPRLNIESLIEPLRQVRGQVGGFCATNSINKMQSSSDNTDNLEGSKVCSRTGEEISVAHLLCSKGITQGGVDGCKVTWCQSVRQDWEVCVEQIATQGWDAVWCAVVTGMPSLPFTCTGDCQKCTSDVSDFGWDVAFEKWHTVVAPADSGECVNLEDLPDDLVGCVPGIRIQYEESPGVYKTLKAIPDSVQICDDSLSFDSLNHPVVFQKPLRLIQCELPDTCLVNRCVSTTGFGATFEFSSVEDTFEEVIDLIKSGDLVCNPERFNSPDACLGFTPEFTCPCPDGR